MPIRNLTDQQRLPRLGKIRTGEMAENDKGAKYPRALDHFVVPPAVEAVYGDKPTVLEPIFFPVEDEERFASTYYRLYTRSFGLTCKGDGETAHRLVDMNAVEATGEPKPAGGQSDAKRTQWMDITCPCPLLEGRQCRPIMNLQFVIPSVPGIGIWQLDTSSIYGIKHVYECVQFIKAFAGRIALIPLKLSLVPMQVNPEGERTKTVYVAQLEISGNITPEQLLATARGLESPVALLPEPDDERPEEITPTEEQIAVARQVEAQQERNGVRKAQPSRSSKSSERRFKTVAEFWAATEEAEISRAAVAVALGGTLGEFLNAMPGRTWDDAWDAVQGYVSAKEGVTDADAAFDDL